MHDPSEPNELRLNDNGNGNGSPAPVEISHSPQHSHVPIHYSRRTPMRVLVFGGVVAAALVAVFAWGLISRHRAQSSQETEVERDAGAPVPVDVVHVQHAPPEKVLSLPGQASSFYETTIYARVSGYLDDWKKDIGDRVKKGEVLAHIDTPELDDQYTAALARVNELKANKLVAQTSAEFATASFKRYQASVQEGAVSQEEVDQKKAELDSTKAKVTAADAQVASADAEVKRLETLRHFKDVVAPFDGVITERHIDPGALVTAGSTTNTSPLFNISQSDRMRVFVDVPQPAVPDVKVGMIVAVAAKEFPGRKFEGKVDRTSSSIDTMSKTLKVEVLVPNPDLVLLPGMYVTATFQTNRSDPPLRIPASALAFGPSGPQVAVVDADDHVSFRDIKIGRDLGDAVEIASGLSGNETVALNVGSQVTDGERVDPHLVDVSTPTRQSGSTVAAMTAAHRVAAHE